MLRQAPGSFRRAVAVLREGLRPRRGVFALAALAGAVYGVAGAATGWWVGRTTETVVVPALSGLGTGPAPAVGAGDVWRAGAVLALIALLSALSQFARRIAAGVTMFAVQADHRRRVARRYLDLPLAWHRARPTGRLLSTAGSDVDTTWQVLAPLPFAIGTVFMVLAAAGFMVAADPVLAAVALTVVPLVAAGSALYQRRVSPLIARMQALRGEVAGVAHESFEGALVVKVLGRREVEVERFTDAATRLRDANTRAGATRGAFDAVIEALPSLGALAVLAVGAVRVAGGASSTADVVQVAYLLTLLAFPVRAIGWVLSDLPRTVVGHARLQEVLSAPVREVAHDVTTLPGASAGRPAPVRVEAVTVRHAAAGPGDPPALDAATLDVAAGTTLAVVGPTGSGKSTLAGLLLRLVDPATGRVVLDGVDVAELADGALAGSAALVPQEVFVFDDTVRGNVALGLEGLDDDAVWAALAAARADGFVRELPAGLDTEVGERGTSLSGGQRQRLAIARALVRRPRLLVLDDATSALDPAVERAVLDGLRAGGAAGGGSAPTVVVVAYRPATIALADEVVHLDSGRVVDRGTPEELLERDPGYADLVTAYARAARERAVAAR